MEDIPDRDNFLRFAQKKKASGYLALGSAWKSYNLNRSTNSATILLLGLTGAGKSHTINNLFNAPVTPVGDGVSCTKNIHEFTVNMPTEMLGISNSKMHVLDTPGFGDTEDGLKFDAKVLGNIRELFERKKKYAPNFIILAVNINDKRLDGKFAPFVKLLKAMKLELSGPVLDPDHPNLVVVLTHLCGALPKFQRDPTGQKLLVQRIVAEHLGIPDVPVEVAENRWEDYELEKSGDDYFLLPNGQLFPRNIYQALISTSKGVDPVGHGIVNEAYPKLQKMGRPSIVETKYPINEVPGSLKIVEDIMRMQGSTSSEIGDSFVQVWEQMDPKIQTVTRLPPTELGLKLGNMGYKKLAELPQSWKDRMTFFRELAPDKGMQELLRRATGLEAPNFSIDLLIGRAFDITKDRITPFNLFALGPSTLTTIGCYMPQNIRATISPQVQFTCNVVKTTEEMTQERLRQLKIQVGLGKIGFNYEHRSGFNIFSQGSGDKLTAVYEQHLIKLERDHQSEISGELKSAVKNLPTIYKKEDASNVQAWQNFFSSYGTHYVTTSYIGGSVIFELSNVNATSGSNHFSGHGGGINGFLSQIFGGGSYGDHSSSQSSSTFAQRDLHITVLGGNPTAASELVTSPSQGEFLRRLKIWEQTILDNPMVTDLSICLGEVADVVNQIEPNVVNAMKNATLDLYNARLVYEAPQTVAPTRDSDSKANAEKPSSSCLMPNTLILTPKGQVSVSSLRKGNTVLDARGQPVKIIGVNKVYSLDNHTMVYGFHDNNNDGGQPFFTGGHTFLAPPSKKAGSGHPLELIVANKQELDQFHPQLTTNTTCFSVQQMADRDIQVMGIDQQQNQLFKVINVSHLTSMVVDIGQELYFLAVEGDGTYIANGFACYHELPDFATWPRTFVAIFRTLQIFAEANKNGGGDGERGTFQTDENGGFETFAKLKDLALKINDEWTVCMENNEDHNFDDAMTTNTDQNCAVSTATEELDLGEALKKFPMIINSQKFASFGMFLYSMCGVKLYRHLDVLKNDMTPLLEVANKILLLEKKNLVCSTCNT